MMLAFGLLGMLCFAALINPTFDPRARGAAALGLVMSILGVVVSAIAAAQAS